MATLKHIASKNSDYSAIEAYLIYQHDEFSGKVILDEQGRPMLRESYLLDTLECGGFSFATACLLANRKYGKNTQHGDIKSHQYIISFDPRDAADNGLTMEKAQALGLKFCEENFPALTYKTVKIHFSEALNDEHIRQLQGFILAQAGIYSYIGTSTVSDRNAHQALEWAKLDVNGRSHNDHKPAIFHRSKGLLSGFFHHGSQEIIA